jgi:DNA-binding SARP family transcriptional activator
VALLGPLVIVDGDGVERSLPARKERAVLAILALRVGRVVSASELIAYLWGDNPPRSAAKTLQTYVSALRRVLPAGTIETTGGGYRLCVPPAQVDVVSFERLIRRGRQGGQAGDYVQAVALLEAALGLWRGEPLAELADQPAGVGEAARLVELRLAGEEELADSRLALGEHATLVGELEQAVAAEPLRERRWAQLMLALYRCGRQADALRAYQRLRAQLREQLGIEPGPEVRMLEERILLQKPDLDWQAPAGAVGHAERDVLTGPHRQPPDGGQARGGGVQSPTALTVGPAWSLPAPLLRASRRNLVGRKVELDRLARRLGEGKHDAQLVLVSGEPGVGKTRLAAALAASALSNEALVLFGRCDEGLRVPYQPFVEALDSYMDWVPSDTLAGQLGTTGRELARLLPHLGDRVPGLRTPTEAEPETERWLLFDATARFVRALAADRRVVLIIDDLHWAEPATLLLLRHVVRSGIDGLLVVATVRSAEEAEPEAFAEAVAGLAREHLLEIMPLGGLSGVGVAALVADRLARTPDQAFARALYDLTGGNPFFVHELLSHLIDLGLVGASDWPTASEVAQSGAPEGLRQVLSRRIGQLSPAAREALMVAAVAGAEFHVADVARAMSGPRDEVIAALEETSALGLVTETTQRPGGYRFAHALVRHTLYATASSLGQAQRHWQLAEAIRAAPGPPERRLDELAYHYRLGQGAGDPATAIPWLQAAGDQAVGQVAFEEAIEHYRAALAALDLGPDDPDRRYQLLAGLGESAGALADFVVSHRSWLAAADIARAAADPARFLQALNGYGALVPLSGQDDTFQRLIRDGLDLVGPGDSAERAQLLARDGNVMWRHGRGRSREEREATVRDAVAMARRVGDITALGRTLEAMGETLLGSSNAAERMMVHREQMQLPDTPGLQAWWAHRGVAVAAIQMGRQSEARAALAEARRLAHATHRRLGQLNARTVEAAVAAAEGRFADAKRLAAEARDLSDAANQTITLSYSAQVGAVRTEQGQTDKVVDTLRFLADNLSPGTLAWRTMLAGIYADTGRLGQAAIEFEKLAPDRFALIPRDWAFPLAIRYLAETCIRLGDATRAAQLLPEVEPYDGQILLVTIGTSIEAAADRSLGQLYELLGRVDDADRHYQAAWQLEDAMGFAALAARSRYWHGRLLARSADLHDRSRACGLLEAAQSTTAALGMSLLDQQIKELYPALSDPRRRPHGTDSFTTMASKSEVGPSPGRRHDS